MDLSDLSFFRREGEAYAPQPVAQSLWSGDQLHGVAVSGLLAVALEERLAAIGRDDLVPARYHVDLFRPATTVATTTRTTVVREGPRLALIDAQVLQDDVPVARATCTFLRPTDPTAGEVWSSSDRPVPPPLDLAPVSVGPRLPLFASETPWSEEFAEHQNGGRHEVWHTAVPVLPGESTPFQAIASIADATSMVTNWGTAGIEYINTDISLALTRLPTGVQVGLRATDHVAADGLAVGTATVYDRDGVIGTSTVTAIANTKRTVDLSEPGVDRTNPTGGA